MAQSRTQLLLERVRSVLLNDPITGANAGPDGVVIGTLRPPAFPVRAPYYVVRDERVTTAAAGHDAITEVIALAVDVYQQLRGGRGDEALVLGVTGDKGLLELAAEVEQLLDGNTLGRFAEIAKTGESHCEIVGEHNGQSFGRRTVTFDVFIHTAQRTRQS